MSPIERSGVLPQDPEALAQERQRSGGVHQVGEPVATTLTIRLKAQSRAPMKVGVRT